KLPEMEIGIITHPLDAVSCIEDARIRARELAGNGIVPDEDGDRQANGCPSLKELLKSIKDNPTPEALEALRRLILDYEDLFDPFFEVFDIGGGGAYASICAELTRNRSIKEGSYPLLTAIELAAINQDAFSIVSNYIIRYYFNGYSNELIDTLTTSIVNSSTTREEKMMMRANYMTRGLLNEVISPTFCDSVSDPKARIILGLTGTKQ
ncbi:MAG: hypothetical protein Q7S22_08680, partial [Candidatus Micrarchaeota archaeon]|nr:hypothetical protein [Candidatus Micrarchaeota archaeon]